MEAILDQIATLEARLKKGGVLIDAVLRDAEVNRSSWTRWKQGEFAPNMARWQRILDAAERRLSRVRA